MTPHYTIDNDIDFFKELTDDTDTTINTNTNTNDINNNNICLITHQPLTKHYVKLYCNHSFNYIPLYNDAISNKKIRIFNSQIPLNHIKCPYCRNIQNKLLPYSNEIKNDLNIEKLIGVNFSNMTPCEYLLLNPTYNIYDNNDNNYPTCANKYKNCTNNTFINASNAINNKYYCIFHLKIVKKEQKEKAKQEKLLIKKQKEKAKQEKLLIKEQKEKAKQEKLLIKEQKEKAKQEKLLIKEQKEKAKQEKLLIKEQKEKAKQEKLLIK
jgi:hypothetical protein